MTPISDKGTPGLMTQNSPALSEGTSREPQPHLISVARRIIGIVALAKQLNRGGA